uniref:Putative ixodes 8-cys protein n=1 Tax=Ixodes ricinus TaxID=34613 RepID=A0A0K8R9L5_IXORI
MFKLKFFILFVLAGLCFGDTSLGESESASPNSEGNSSPSETAGESSGNGDPSGASRNIAENNLHLPGFVGDVKNKMDLLNELVNLCTTTQPSTSASTPIISTRSETSSSYDVVNQDSLNFTACTFKCKKPTGQEFTLRMPPGTVCNEKKYTCGDTGVCPPMPLPAC